MENAERGGDDGLTPFGGSVVFAVDENGTVAIGATDLDSGDPVLATAA